MELGTHYPAGGLEEGRHQAMEEARSYLVHHDLHNGHCNVCQTALSSLALSKVPASAQISPVPLCQNSAMLPKLKRARSAPGDAAWKVTVIDALYQEYLPSQAVQSVPHNQLWGFREFSVRDPFGNLLLFAERLPEPEPEARSEHDPRG